MESPSRVYLRPPRSDDGSRFLALVAASRALHHPWVDPPSDRESFRRWSQRAVSPRCAGNLICLCGSDELVGVANLNDIEREPQPRARLGFYGFAGHTGRGYVREGVARLLERAFGELGLLRVEAEVSADNARSMALLEHLGFRREDAPARRLRVGGAWREHECWSLRRGAGRGSEPGVYVG